MPAPPVPPPISSTTSPTPCWCCGAGAASVSSAGPRRAEPPPRPGPGPGALGVGECLEHLNIVGGYFLPIIGARLRRAQERGSRPAPTVKHGLIGARLVAGLRIPPPRNPA
ncbi:MAG: hypothetical protein WKG07_20310 [Hymenobacter sp.]